MKKSSDREGTDSAVWFKYFPARWAGLAMREPDNAKLGERVRGIILALCDQEPGADAFADSVMQSTAEAMKAASEHGRKGAVAMWEKRKGKDKCPSNARASSNDPAECPSNAKRRDLRDSGDLEDENEQIERETEQAGATLSQFEIPSWENFKAFGAERGFPANRVEKCFRHYEASGWKDSQGQPIRNWKAKLSSWMNRPELAEQGDVRPRVGHRRPATYLEAPAGKYTEESCGF